MKPVSSQLEDAIIASFARLANPDLESMTHERVLHAINNFDNTIKFRATRALITKLHSKFSQ